jgi:uroporphyrinogen decarboxylase
MKDAMTPMERVLTTLGHEEPDRVPYFLLLTGHGAQLLNMHPEEYFSSGQNVARAQLKMQEIYGHDCFYPFFYASLETQAWGGSTVFYDDGPPNAGKPIIESFEQIDELEAPDVMGHKGFDEVRKSINILYREKGEEIPIIAVVMSPFSLPVMQMGFDRYFDLIYEDRKKFWELMNVNKQFCTEWANSQLEAGATAICYFDPVSSPTIVPRETFLETGYKVAKDTIGNINGAVATHLASGRSMAILEDLQDTGAAALGVSAMEDLTELKDRCRGKISLLGNLNAIEMRHWTAEQAENKVRQAMEKAGAGGGYILSDNHGEMVWDVSHETLLSIANAVKKYGGYPLEK